MVGATIVADYKTHDTAGAVAPNTHYFPKDVIKKTTHEHNTVAKQLKYATNS